MGSNPPEPKASVALPPEILDKILEHIPTDREGRPTLISCALVAAWWTGPSQRRLFSSVSINNKNYQRWLGGVALSGSKTHLLQHVRSLRYYRSLGKGVRHPIPIQGLPAGEYFSALHNIHTLELVNIKIERSSKAEFGTCFSAFRETLTGLTLELLTTSFDALVNLVDYFPNVVTLRLSPSILELDEGPVPPLSRPLRGKLHIYYTEHDCLEFIDRFARLDMEYEELVIGSWFGLPTRFMESSLQLSPGTVKYLRLTVTLQRGAVLMIHGFRQLQELELVAAWPDSTYQVLLSSINSTQLRKIIIQSVHAYHWRTQKMALIDKELCELVARLGRMGHRHTLEVELRFTGIGVTSGTDEYTDFLSRFRGEGIVTIIDAVHDLVLHSSTDNR